MKLHFLSTTVLFLCVSIHLSAQSDAIAGTWFAEEMDNSTIVIAKNGETYSGKVVTSDNQKNLGVKVLRDLRYDPEDNRWTGTIYSPKRDMTIDATVTLIGGEQLKVVGTKLFLTKTMYFRKADTP